jgi:hypothetical protein
MRVDYLDSFNIMPKKKGVNLEQVVKAFFLTTPSWIIKLLELRHFLVRSIGLKTCSYKDTKYKFPLIEGDSIGLFKVFEIHEKEILLGEDDSHLDFRVSIKIEPNQSVEVKTIVQFNSLFGKVYFNLIKPFHIIIVRSMLKKMEKELK